MYRATLLLCLVGCRSHEEALDKKLAESLPQSWAVRLVQKVDGGLLVDAAISDGTDAFLFHAIWLAHRDFYVVVRDESKRPAESYLLLDAILVGEGHEEFVKVAAGYEHRREFFVQKSKELHAHVRKALGP